MKKLSSLVLVAFTFSILASLGAEAAQVILHKGHRRHHHHHRHHHWHHHHAHRAVVIIK